MLQTNRRPFVIVAVSHGNKDDPITKMIQYYTVSMKIVAAF